MNKKVWMWAGLVIILILIYSQTVLKWKFTSKTDLIYKLKFLPPAFSMMDDKTVISDPKIGIGFRATYSNGKDKIMITTYKYSFFPIGDCPMVQITEKRQRCETQTKDSIIEQVLIDGYLVVMLVEKKSQLSQNQINQMVKSIVSYPR